MTTYYEVKISAETRTLADKILDSLLQKRLVTGGQFITAPARFWWKGKIVDMAEYLTIATYTTEKHRQAIMDDVRRTTAEEVPMIAFVAPNHLNPELRTYIDQALAD